ncbi:MAG: DUF4358 domain-containing protein [Prevotella sp.]|nr:DUF4358 domain-containing protein [Prevotella sp.]
MKGKKYCNMYPKNIKKAAAAISVLVMSAALLASCGGDGDGDQSSATSETSSATETGASETADVIPNDTVTETDGTDSAENGDGSETDAENPLQPLADAALSVGEWPMLWEVTDPMMLSDFFLLDAENENYRGMIVLQCPMSTPMTEVIIIEAEDAESARADLEARRNKAIEQDAFYPNDVDAANASIIGTEGDYAYFILSDNAPEAETALTEAIKTL